MTTQATQQDDVETGTWAIVELMGHRVIAGYVRQSERFGRPLLQIEVPATSAFPAFTQFYGLDSIYCITPVSEEVAKLTGESHKTDPVAVYVPDLDEMRRAVKENERLREQLNAARALGPGSRDPGEDDEDYDDLEFDD